MKIGDKLKPTVPPLEAGTYLGVCVGVVGLGEQETTWQGKTRYSQRVKIIFDIPEETMEQDGQQRPRQLSVDFAFTRSAKGKFRQFLSSWLGKTMTDTEYAEFDTDALFGRNATLGVVRSEDNQYASIVSATPLRRSEKPIKTDTEFIKFDADEWDDKVFETLPEYLQERLKKSAQYRNAHLPEQEVSVEAANQEAAQDADSGEECPF